MISESTILNCFQHLIDIEKDDLVIVGSGDDAGVINFKETIKLLKIRGNAMQNAVPKNEGSMIAVLGEEIKKIEEIIKKL